MSATASSPHPPSVEEAVRLILQKNFDADSKICFLTLLKIIDNILQKPGNEKVRSLRTANATIRSKIMDKHGHHLLMACGFVHEPADLKWNTEERLVLKEDKEDTQILIKARHTLARIATLELGLQAGDIPPYKVPPAPVSISNKTTTTTTSFDVYSGNRFDGQSAAIGANLGPPKNWKSKTEQELEALKQREAKLQAKMAKKPFAIKAKVAVDRQWTVFLPGQTHSVTEIAAPTSSAAAAATTTSTKGDASLLASHFQQQHAKRVAADNRGFTTKAMRDLEKLKKTKVYSHTQLAIHFPDGISVRANFATKEKLLAVMDGLTNEVLFSTETLPLPPFELYQTPPRRVLGNTESLQSLGLVPAAKVYVSWKQPLPKLAGAGNAWYIKPEVLGGNSTSESAPALPTSVPVLQSESDKAKSSTGDANSNNNNNTAVKRKKTRAEKEAEMMKRMLGKR